MSFIITTTSTPLPHMERRALEVAQICNMPFVPRHASLKKLLAKHGTDLAYVLGHDYEYLIRGKLTLKMHPGLVYLKQRAEMDHPLIRAVAPPEARPTGRIIDGTLGLASDAIHMATLLNCPIQGIEITPVLACLCEAGLKQIGQTRKRLLFAAENIKIHIGNTEDYLKSQGDNSADVVFLDPMFEVPGKAAPGFELLREFACHTPLTKELMAQALRVAKQRVVIKVSPCAPSPLKPAKDFSINRWIRSRSVDFYVAEMAFKVGPEEALPPQTDT